ncbi:MAG: hypothetical protein PW788_09455 [Micavibrio sp.]|nr:hypothetical protein [Micavibrio sp.]
MGLISLHAAYLLAGLSTCPDMGKPEVHVQLNASDPPYYTNMSSADLTAGFSDNPDSTLATDGNWMVGGLTVSDLRGEYTVNFKTLTYEDGTVCMSVSNVDFEIVYTPVIYIASDFLNKTCKYTVTKAHERLHVGTDLETINDFTPQIEDQLHGYVDTLGSMGPFDAASVNGEQTAITNTIQQDAAPILDELIEVRRQRQGKIDTIENYKRETALCPGEFPNFDGSQ